LKCVPGNAENAKEEKKKMWKSAAKETGLAIAAGQGSSKQSKQQDRLKHRSATMADRKKQLNDNNTQWSRIRTPGKTHQ